jgi:hypothetical protein
LSLTEGKFATVLIIPSSWGSQLDGDLHQHHAASMGNTTVTTVSSPESRKRPSDDFDDAYIKLDDDFIAEARAIGDTNVVKDLLARRAVRYKLSPDAKFAASPINLEIRIMISL